GQALLVPGEDGRLHHVVFGLGAANGGLDPMALRALPARLPAGDYRIAQAPAGLDREQATLAFALGSYRFDRYKKKPGARARLVAEGCDAEEVRQVAHASALARDMVNTPANDLGPLQI